MLTRRITPAFALGIPALAFFQPCSQFTVVPLRFVCHLEDPSVIPVLYGYIGLLFRQKFDTVRKAYGASEVQWCLSLANVF